MALQTTILPESEGAVMRVDFGNPQMVPPASFGGLFFIGKTHSAKEDLPQLYEYHEYMVVS